jgi:hypothetical protein
MKILLTLFLMIHTLAFAASEKAEVCSSQTTICSEIQMDKPFTSKEEGRFRLFLKNGEAEFKKVDLWMQMGNHGHGSSPLAVTQVAPGNFDVTKAYFVMKGNWQVRVRYRLGSLEEVLIIPVMIKD